MIVVFTIKDTIDRPLSNYTSFYADVRIPKSLSKDGQGNTDGVESSHPKKDAGKELFLLPGTVAFAKSA